MAVSRLFHFLFVVVVVVVVDALLLMSRLIIQLLFYAVLLFVMGRPMDTIANEKLPCDH